MILGVVDHDQGRLNDLSLEMLTWGRCLATQMGVPLGAVLVGEAARPLAGRLQAHGVSVVYLACHDQLGVYAPGAWAQSVVEVVATAAPSVVVAPGSDRGNEVLAHVAARSDLPMAAHCVAATPGDPFLVTRVRWGGSLLEEARLHGAVKLLTVAPHALPAEQAPAGELTLRTLTPSLGARELRVRVTGRAEVVAGRLSLAEAKVVVGGGRGVGSAEGFRTLEALAELLGGAVGCSRAVTSLGWRPHADQIGQTGTRIAPELYLACGVSGATQHLVGCQAAKRIVAINTDPEATMVARAHYAVIGDLHEVLPAVTAEIRRVKGRAGASR